MAKIISVNAGSSSLKFQLFEMPSEEVLTSGIVEKIGFEDAMFTIKVNGEKIKKTLPIPDHTKAVALLLEALVEYKIVESLDEIVGAGHRAVHGGEIFKESVPVTDEVVEQFTSLNDLAPLHNPAGLIGYNAFKENLPNCKHVTQLSIRQCQKKAISIHYQWNITKTIKYVVMASTVLVTNMYPCVVLN